MMSKDLITLSVWEPCLTCVYMNITEYSLHKRICGHAIVCNKIQGLQQLLPSKENTNEEINRSINNSFTHPNRDDHGCDEDQFADHTA